MGTGLVNRLGKKFTPIAERIDRTSIFVGAVMLRKPKIENCELLPDGCVRFQLPLKSTGMTSMDLRGAKLMRSRWFGNCVGEFLVRINMAQFDEIVLGAGYPKLDRTKRHGQFGYRFAGEFIEFKFHVELLLRIFNESLRRELREIEV